ncbi:MAG TPA: hypothetical protein PKA05_16390, partial [Roseiflexaceae bacterium]|nr:hypothetical protein [Roseiflexaceae bacterium]
IRSHRDAIGFVLRQHGVAYSEISLAQPWPAAFNYYAYGSAIYPYTLDVRVVRPDAAPLSGSFLCRNGQRDCVITLRDVGIITVAAPDPFDQRLHPWIDAVFEQIDRMLTTMRR